MEWSSAGSHVGEDGQSVEDGQSRRSFLSLLFGKVTKRVCRLCHTGALGDERHMLLECPALADLRDEYSPLVAECSRVMARLVWARNQPMVSRYIIACLDRMSC